MNKTKILGLMLVFTVGLTLMTNIAVDSENGITFSFDSNGFFHNADADCRIDTYCFEDDYGEPDDPCVFDCP